MSTGPGPDPSDLLHGGRLGDTGQTQVLGSGGTINTFNINELCRFLQCLNLTMLFDIQQSMPLPV